MLKKKLLKSFFEDLTEGQFKVVYWDGEEVAYGTETQVTIKFNKPLPADFKLDDPILSFGEAYMEGIIDFEGSIEELMRVIKLNNEELTFNNLSGKLMSKFNDLKNKAIREKQKEDIQHHYDLGNDFFSLWLDDTMCYSCAYFKDSEDSLYQAQLQKIDLALQKLKLNPGERLLDIGSGWGWLIIRAAQQYDVEALGVTLSEEQYKATKERIEELNLSDQVEVRLIDYMDLSPEEKFDKVVSVGMFEHVGKENLSKYMEKVKELLVPGGLSVLHTITGLSENSVNSWIDKYIFPGGYIPTLHEILSLFAEYDFCFIHGENLRQHYAMTLDRWYERFLQHLDTVEEMFDERFVRMWELYLKGAAANFRIGGLHIHQLLFSNGVNNDLPLTKDWISS